MPAKASAPAPAEVQAEQSEDGQTEMTGLTNLGNTCFFNSVCQGMAHTLPLIEYLTDDDTAGRVKGELSVALCIFLRLYQRNQGKVMSPQKLWEMVCRQHQPFSSYSQQDAHELYIFLLDGLESEYASRPSGDSSPTPSSPKSDEPKKKKKKKKVNNIIRKIFRGEFQSVVLCKGCGERSYKGDDFFRDISVEVVPPEATTQTYQHSPYNNNAQREAKFQRRRIEQLHALMEQEGRVAQQELARKEDELEAAVKAAEVQKQKDAEDLLTQLLDEESREKAAAAGGKKKGKKDTHQDPFPHSTSQSSTFSDEKGNEGGTKKEQKAVRMIQTLERQQHEARDKIQREADKGLETILNVNKPKHLPNGVTAVSMDVIEEYSRTFEEGPTLVKCLQSFFSPEFMDGKNLYRCGKCGNECPASKQLSIASAPSVLAVHLKRFHQDYMTGTSHKLNGYVAFPLSLKLDPYMAHTAVLPAKSVPLYKDSCFEKYGPSQDEVEAGANFLRSTDALNDTGKVVYRLYSVIVHEGWMNQGHYYCYVRPYDAEKKQRMDTWFCVSDERVQEVPVFEVCPEFNSTPQSASVGMRFFFTLQGFL